MSQTELLPVNRNLKAVVKAGRLAYILESLAIVLLAALAAYAASA